MKRKDLTIGVEYAVKEREYAGSANRLGRDGLLHAVLVDAEPVATRTAGYYVNAAPKDGVTMRIVTPNARYKLGAVLKVRLADVLGTWTDHLAIKARNDAHEAERLQARQDAWDRQVEALDKLQTLVPRDALPGSMRGRFANDYGSRVTAVEALAMVEAVLTAERRRFRALGTLAARR